MNRDVYLQIFQNKHICRHDTTSSALYNGSQMPGVDLLYSLSVSMLAVWQGKHGRSYLALRLDHVFDHGQEGHLVLDALGEGQVALESAVEGLTVFWCLGSNRPCHLQHLTLHRLSFQGNVMYD